MIQAICQMLPVRVVKTRRAHIISLTVLTLTNNDYDTHDEKNKTHSTADDDNDFDK